MRSNDSRSASGWDMFLKTWQELVVAELTPEHHRSEKSHLSFTTHMFTETLFSRHQEGVLLPAAHCSQLQVLTTVPPASHTSAEKPPSSVASWW
uniref:Uncharacterized protein n=1 Tax=Denticeps clupeoides TaxID=299321 RepID=A0AAY4E9S9_9TELE